MVAGQDSRGGTETLPFYAAGCYAVPTRFLYGTAAETNFWDVVYFRAHEGGGEFDTSTEELVNQMGLSRQMVSQLHREGVEHDELIEDVSWFGGRRFVLGVPGFDRSTKGIIWKPLGYVRNGWHYVVTPAIPKRVLNLFLQQPRRQVYQLDVAYIATKCKRYSPFCDCKPQGPLNATDVGKALRLLVRLGLLVPEGNGFRIDWATFNRPSPSVVQLFDAPDLHENPLFCKAATGDPDRAERALELLDIGQYDMEMHFEEIFRDLAYIRDDDYPLLKAKARSYRNRPPSSHQWRDTWKAFQYELKRRITELRTPKWILNLAEVTSAACTLAPDFQTEKSILDARMVSRVEWPWYLQEEAGVYLELRVGDRVLLGRSVGPSDAEVRYRFQPKEWQGLAASLVLHALCERPLPGLRVETWLEVRLRK